MTECGYVLWNLEKVLRELPRLPASHLDRSPAAAIFQNHLAPISINLPEQWLLGIQNADKKSLFLKELDPESTLLESFDLAQEMAQNLSQTLDQEKIWHQFLVALTEKLAGYRWQRHKSREALSDVVFQESNWMDYVENLFQIADMVS